MNQRIKELTDLAMRQLGCGYTVEDAGLFASRQVRELINETAELILRELIDKISQEQDIAEQNWQCKNGVHICHKLTEHFGVEE